MNIEIGRVSKNNVSLVEYNTPDERLIFFLQSGVVGLYATEKELRDIHAVLNYYFNLEDFSNCILKIGEEDNVAI